MADLCFWMPEADLLDFILDTRPIFDFGHKWLIFILDISHRFSILRHK